MRRRLDLAASLVHRPAVLFLDEPTTGLDPRSRNELWNVIEDLVADGTTVLLTTQYLEEADRLADYLAVVDHGQIIAQGTPAGLKAGLGSTALEIGMPGEGSALMALQALAPLGVQPPILDGTTVKVTVADGGTALLEALRALDARASPPPEFPCGNRASTTSSCPSPATPPCLDGSRKRARHDLHRHLDPRPLPDGGARGLEPRPPAGSPGAEAVAPRRPPEPPRLGRVRRRRHHLAQPHRLHPHPGDDGLLLDPADHVRAVVPLRLRRSHPGPWVTTTSTT